MAEHLLEMRGICKAFPGVKALDQVDLILDKGEVMALAGENGAGKSTLMKVLSGAYKPDSGSIYLNGQMIDSTKNSPLESLTRGISIIYQELNYLSGVSIAENIFIGHLPKKKSGIIDYKKLYSDSIKIQEELGLGNLDPGQEAGALLTAQKQLLEIARAFARNSKIIVMDEPTASLTEQEIEHLYTIIEKFKKQGGTVIFISHKLDEIFRICDSVMVMRDGRNVMRQAITDVTKDSVVEAMVGRELKNMYPIGSHEIKETVFEAEGLSTDFLKDISLSVKKGEIVGLYGLMGAGCEEVTRCLYGIEPVKRGTIKVNGKAVELNNPSQSIRYGIAYVPGERKSEGLLLNLSVSANITLAVLKNYVRRGILNLRAEEKNAWQWIKTLGIKTPDTAVEVQNLSGGNQQKVVFAKCLNMKPQILLLNEPTRGVDVGAKAEIYRLMEKFCDDGMGILMVSSEMPETMAICDRIIILHDGKVTGRFDKKEGFGQIDIMKAVLGEN